MNKSGLFAVIGAMFALCPGTSGESMIRPGATFTFHHENVLGTSLELKITASSSIAAGVAERNALAEIDRLAAILSGYDSSSEFARWMAQPLGRPTRVSPELFEVLSLFESWRAKTGGALDASAETAVRVWRNAAAQNRVPSEVELRTAVVTMQREHWRLDRSAGTASRLTDAPLRLNSFAKSYVVDRAAAAAVATPDVDGVVVNIGGDLVVRGDVRELVAIADPFSPWDNGEPAARLLAGNAAVATSGNYKRGFEIGGRHYSHIVDPRTGQTAEQIASVTVVAPDGASAGAMATAFSVMDVADSERMAASMRGVEYLIVQRDGRRIASAGWSRMEAPPLALAAAAAPQRGSYAAASQAAGTAAANWNAAFELIMNLELARIDGQRYRRPFVAVWIEDKDKFPVRTVALWFDKQRWLPELKAWHRGDRMRALAEGTAITGSVSSATRPAGKYSVKWDGKDNAGKLVKSGKYSVCIEVSREHGGYQIIRQEIDFSAVPRQVDFPGGAEIGSASLDYRKIAH